MKSGSSKDDDVSSKHSPSFPVKWDPAEKRYEIVQSTSLLMYLNFFLMLNRASMQPLQLISSNGI